MGKFSCPFEFGLRSGQIPSISPSANRVMAPSVVGFIPVFIAAFVLDQSLVNLVLLDFDTLLSVLGWLAVVWGRRLVAKLSGFPERVTCPLFIGLTVIVCSTIGSAMSFGAAWRTC